MVRKSSYFLEQFQIASGSRVLSEWSRKRTLTKVDTTASFDVVAKTPKWRDFFSDGPKAMGIAGEFAGAMRTWKLNTYGLTWEQIKHAANSILEITGKYGLGIN